MDETYITFIENYLINHNWDKYDIDREIRKILQQKSTLRETNLQLFEAIEGAVGAYCVENNLLDDDIYDEVNSCDPEEILSYLFDE